MSFINEFRVAVRKVVTTKAIYDMNIDKREFVYMNPKRENENDKLIQEILDNGYLFWRSLFDLKALLMENEYKEEDEEEVTQLIESLNKIGITFVDNKGTLFRVRQSRYDLKKLGISHDVAVKVILDDLRDYYYMTFDYVLTNVISDELSRICMCESAFNQIIAFNSNKDKMRNIELKAYNQLINKHVNDLAEDLKLYGINKTIDEVVGRFKISGDTERKAYSINRVYNKALRKLRSKANNIRNGVTDADIEYIVNKASKFVTSDLIEEFLSDLVVDNGGIIRLD